MNLFTNSGRLQPNSSEYALNGICGAYEDAASGHATTWLWIRQDNGDSIVNASTPGEVTLQICSPGSPDKELYLVESLAVPVQSTLVYDCSTLVGKDVGPFTIIVRNRSAANLQVHAHIQSN